MSTSPLQVERFNSPEISALGAYSLVVRGSGLVAISGQVAAGSDGKPMGRNIESQTEEVLRRLDIALDAVGSTRAQLLRVGVFITNVDDFAAMDCIYAEWIGDLKPARTTLVVSLPKEGLLIEADALAIASDQRWSIS